MVGNFAAAPHRNRRQSRSLSHELSSYPFLFFSHNRKSTNCQCQCVQAMLPIPGSFLISCSTVRHSNFIIGFCLITTKTKKKQRLQKRYNNNKSNINRVPFVPLPCGDVCRCLRTGEIRKRSYKKNDRQTKINKQTEMMMMMMIAHIHQRPPLISDEESPALHISRLPFRLPIKKEGSVGRKRDRYKYIDKHKIQGVCNS